MNMCHAFEILHVYSLKNDSRPTFQEIKQQYHKMALLYHPDKTLNMDSGDKFKEINEAYNYIKSNYNDDDDYENTDAENTHPLPQNTEKYGQLLRLFLNNVYHQLPQQTAAFKEKTDFFEIVEEIIYACEKNVISILKHSATDKHTLNNICHIITKYKDIFHISINVLNKIQDFIRTEYDVSGCNVPAHDMPNCIVLTPKLKDLLEGNVYVYQPTPQCPTGEMIYVPLWALGVDLTYDIFGKEITFQCVETFPPPTNGVTVVKIDESTNDLYVSISLNIRDIWNKEKVDFSIDGVTFSIDVNILKFKETQTVVLEKCGIPVYNFNDEYDTTVRGDIVVSLLIFFEKTR